MNPREELILARAPWRARSRWRPILAPVMAPRSEAPSGEGLRGYAALEARVAALQARGAVLRQQVVEEQQLLDVE